MPSPRHSLVVIPLSKMTYRFGMSAPLGYLFAGRESLVHGVFSCELTPTLVQRYESFIVELNWVTELYEFRLLCAFIRRHQPAARILFGGLFAQQHSARIFQACPVDLTIGGDSEVPLGQYLDGVALENIANLSTRDRRADITYRFEADAYAELAFSLDWFPSYRDLLRQHLAGQTPTLGPLTADEVNYAFPLLVTTKQCAVAHDGCGYCLGAHPQAFHNDVQLDPQALVRILRRLERRPEPEYGRISLYGLSDISHYDFSGLSFDLELFVEYDGPLASPAQVDALAGLLHAFARGTCRLPASRAGIHDRSRDLDYRALVEGLETPQHRVGFLLYEEDRARAASLGIDEAHAVYHLDVFDYYGRLRFDAYADYGRAMLDSIELYAASHLEGPLNVRRLLKT